MSYPWPNFGPANGHSAGVSFSSTIFDSATVAPHPTLSPTAVFPYDPSQDGSYMMPKRPPFVQDTVWSHTFPTLKTPVVQPPLRFNTDTSKSAQPYYGLTRHSFSSMSANEAVAARLSTHPVAPLTARGRNDALNARLVENEYIFKTHELRAASSTIVIPNNNDIPDIVSPTILQDSETKKQSDDVSTFDGLPRAVGIIGTDLDETLPPRAEGSAKRQFDQLLQSENDIVAPNPKRLSPVGEVAATTSTQLGSGITMAFRAHKSPASTQQTTCTHDLQIQDDSVESSSSPSDDRNDAILSVASVSKMQVDESTTLPVTLLTSTTEYHVASEESSEYDSQDELSESQEDVYDILPQKPHCEVPIILPITEISLPIQYESNETAQQESLAQTLSDPEPETAQPLDFFATNFNTPIAISDESKLLLEASTENNDASPLTTEPELPISTASASEMQRASHATDSILDECLELVLAKEIDTTETTTIRLEPVKLLVQLPRIPVCLVNASLQINSDNFNGWMDRFIPKRCIVLEMRFATDPFDWQSTPIETKRKTRHNSTSMRLSRSTIKSVYARLVESPSTLDLLKSLAVSSFAPSNKSKRYGYGKRRPDCAENAPFICDAEQTTCLLRDASVDNLCAYACEQGVIVIPFTVPIEPAVFQLYHNREVVLREYGISNDLVLLDL